MTLFDTAIDHQEWGVHANVCTSHRAQIAFPYTTFGPCRSQASPQHTKKLFAPPPPRDSKGHFK